MCCYSFNSNTTHNFDLIHSRITNNATSRTTNQRDSCYRHARISCDCYYSRIDSITLVGSNCCDDGYGGGVNVSVSEDDESASWFDAKPTRH